MDQFRLDGQRALITGGSRGIGLGIAKGFADAGADVVLAARSEEELTEAEAEVKKSGHDVAVSSVDLSQTGRIGAWYQGIVAEHGPIDILVNDAGAVEIGPAEDMAIETFEKVITLNLVAVFAVCQAFAKERIASGKPGRIINMGSLAAIEVARAPAAPYPASKGGVVQLSKDLAFEWAPKGILVNVLAPGWIDTPMNAQLVGDDTFNAWLRDRVPLSRWGKPEEIVGPALLLASDAGRFMTGCVVIVDGGLTATM
jgi:gluconate 5-dehydrogenase